jgi:hypothetical protein
LFSVHLQAREIRDRYLRGLGTQSYGSFARKKMRGQDEIVIWGAGQLAVKILPWLTKLDSSVRLWVRCLEKSQSIQEKFPKLNVEVIERVVDAPTGGLIVAAPVPSKVVTEMLDRHSWNPEIVLDFRSESRADPLSAEYDSMGLEEIFSEIRSVKTQMSDRVSLARAEIARLVREQGSYENQNSRTQE